jgi:hypothetical protein
VSDIILIGNQKAFDDEDDERQIAKLDPNIREGVRAQVNDKKAARRACMSPAGALSLPALLDKRRIEFDIIDQAFHLQAAFEFVLLYQIETEELSGGTYGKDSPILIADTTRHREEREAPRGIIVGAGLKALDALRSNGIDLGHIVTHTHAAPYSRRVAIIRGEPIRVLMLQAGDIVGSEDTAQAIREGTARVEVSEDAETGFAYHYYKAADGKLWKPHASIKGVY